MSVERDLIPPGTPLNNPNSQGATARSFPLGEISGICEGDFDSRPFGFLNYVDAPVSDFDLRPEVSDPAASRLRRPIRRIRTKVNVGRSGEPRESKQALFKEGFSDAERDSIREAGVTEVQMEESTAFHVLMNQAKRNIRLPDVGSNINLRNRIRSAINANDRKIEEKLSLIHHLEERYYQTSGKEKEVINALVVGATISFSNILEEFKEVAEVLQLSNYEEYLFLFTTAFTSFLTGKVGGLSLMDVLKWHPPVEDSAHDDRTIEKIAFVDVIRFLVEAPLIDSDNQVEIVVSEDMSRFRETFPSLVANSAEVVARFTGALLDSTKEEFQHQIYGAKGGSAYLAARREGDKALTHVQEIRQRFKQAILDPDDPEHEAMCQVIQKYFKEGDADGIDQVLSIADLTTNNVSLRDSYRKVTKHIEEGIEVDFYRSLAKHLYDFATNYPVEGVVVTVEDIGDIVVTNGERGIVPDSQEVFLPIQRHLDGIVEATSEKTYYLDPEKIDNWGQIKKPVAIEITIDGTLPRKATIALLYQSDEGEALKISFYIDVTKNDPSQHSIDWSVLEPLDGATGEDVEKARASALFVGRDIFAVIHQKAQAEKEAKDAEKMKPTVVIEKKRRKSSGKNRTKRPDADRKGHLTDDKRSRDIAWARDRRAEERMERYQSLLDSTDEERGDDQETVKKAKLSITTEPTVTLKALLEEFVPTKKMRKAIERDLKIVSEVEVDPHHPRGLPFRRLLTRDKATGKQLYRRKVGSYRILAKRPDKSNPLWFEIFRIRHRRVVYQGLEEPEM